jgi:hypothetical protein
MQINYIHYNSNTCRTYVIPTWLQHIYILQVKVQRKLCLRFSLNYDNPKKIMSNNCESY